MSLSKIVKCLSWNVRSFCNKPEVIMGILIDNEIDFAFISETWFSSQSNSITALIRTYGFEMIHVFREKRGGGVGILWKKCLQNHVRFSSIKNNFDTFQYQIIIFNGTTRTNFICIYRFQETPSSVFFEELNCLLLQVDPSNPIILVGDFNFHFEKSNKPDVMRLTDVMSSLGFSQFVCGPTHRKGHTLDLLFANENYFNFDSNYPIDYNISDHFPVFLMCLFVLMLCTSVKSKLFTEISKELI